MSTLERKEYQQTKIMRTVSPVRNFRSSSQNLAEFDSNLGYLLEDLQNSVSRPSSSLGSHRETSRTLESSKSNSLNRFTSVKPSNPVTEYASDDAYNYSVTIICELVIKFRLNNFFCSLLMVQEECIKQKCILTKLLVVDLLQKNLECKIASINWTPS